VSGNVNTGDVEREITLQGTPEAIEKARAAITEKVNSSVCRFMHLNYPSLTVIQGQKKPPGGNRNDYDNQYNQSGYRSPPHHSAQSQGATSQQSQSGAAANAADPYAPWGGYEAYAQMYYAMMAQQQAAAAAAAQQQGGAAPGSNDSGAPGTS
jgi:far upstream element-binding protein